MKSNIVKCIRCENVTDIKNIKREENKPKCCPECGGILVSLQPPKLLDKYLFVNYEDEYYIYRRKKGN